MLKGLCNIRSDFSIFAVLMLIPSLSGSFISENESKLFADAVQNQPDAKDYFNGLKSAMKDARIFLFKQDALRALGLAFITLICILFYHRKRVLVYLYSLLSGCLQLVIIFRSLKGI